MNQIPESVRRRMQAPAGSDHPDADVLTAFAEHALAGGEREQVLTHLAACSVCREVVALAMPEPSAVEVVAPAAPSWFRWPVLRWTAVAATVVIVGAAVSVLVRRPALTDVSVPASTAASARGEPVAGREKEADDARQALTAQETGQATPARPGSVGKLQKGAGSEFAAAEVKKAPMPIIAGSRDERAADKLAALPAAKPAEAEAKTKASSVEESKTLKAEGAKDDAARKDQQMLDAAVANRNVQTGPTANAVNQNVAVAGGIAANQEQAQGRAMQAPQAAPVPSAQAQDLQYLKQRQQNEAIGGYKVQSQMTPTVARKVAVPPARWRVSDSGTVENSADGKAWNKVEIDPGVIFRAMSSNDGDLWAGGAGGALFHSADGGRTWSRVKVGMEGMWVSETIIAVDFSTTKMGLVTTASHALWVTQDGGLTWQRRQ